MKLSKPKKNWGGGIDQVGKWRSLGMCWMNVGFKIWDIVATNSLRVMGMGRGIRCERDSIEQLVRRNGSQCSWLQKWFILRVAHRITS